MSLKVDTILDTYFTGILSFTVTEFQAGGGKPALCFPLVVTYYNSHVCLRYRVFSYYVYLRLWHEVYCWHFILSSYNFLKSMLKTEWKENTELWITFTLFSHLSVHFNSFKVFPLWIIIQIYLPHQFILNCTFGGHQNDKVVSLPVIWFQIYFWD